MNGAAVSQDLLCRSLGRCRAGRPIDREFGARLDAPGLSSDNLFTYVRYDADLSDEALQAFGIRETKRRRGRDATASRHRTPRRRWRRP
jgi:hypothetical protein